MKHLAISLCLLSVACQPEPPPDRFPAPAAIPVEVVQLAPRPLEAEIDLHGVLESAEEVVVNVEFAAPVVRILAEEGHSVSKGEPLLELDTRKLALTLEQTEHLLGQARAQLENARLDLERLRALAEQDTVALQRYDDARFTHEAAVARVRELESRSQLIRRDLEDRVVSSPTDAVVGVRHVEAGQSIMAYQPLMTLHAVQSIKVSVFVGESLLPYLDVGNRGRVETVSGEVDSTIHSISAAADPRTGNYEIKLLIQNATALLKPGMTARVTLQMTPHPHLLMIPDSALVAWKGRHVVYLANGDAAERRDVEVSVGFDDQLVVDGGLSHGDRLIVRGAHRVTQGAPLEIASTDRP